MDVSVSLCCSRSIQSAAAAALSIDGSLLLKIPDHIKDPGTLSAQAGPIHSSYPENTVSVLGREEGYTVKYTPSPERVPEGKARGNS